MIAFSLSGMMAVAHEQHPTLEACGPALMVSSVQRSPVLRIKSVAATPLNSAAAALGWLSENRILVAAGNLLTIMKLNENVLRTRSQLPAFHSDDIRDIQVRIPTRPPACPPQICFIWMQQESFNRLIWAGSCILSRPAPACQADTMDKSSSPTWSAWYAVATIPRRHLAICP